MSVYKGGCFRRSAGVMSAISKQLKSVNLKPLQRITFTFDPFNESAKTTREFLFYLSGPKVAQTNPKCAIKSDVICNRGPSEVKFNLIPSAQEQLKAKEIRFVSENLTVLELLQLFNKHISVLAPPEDLTGVVQTKSEKKAVAGQRKIGKKK